MRSMWHLGKGEIDDAYTDAMACHRLARLVKQSPSLIAQLVAVSIESIALQLDLAILDSDQLTLEQAKRFRNDLASLKPSTNITWSLDTSERYTYLETVTNLSTGKLDDDFDSIREGVVIGTCIDWNIPMKMGNEWYDRLVAALKKQGVEDRASALDALEHEFVTTHDKYRSYMSWFRTSLLRDARSELVGDILGTLMYPYGTTSSNKSQDRIHCKLELTRIAAELAIYRIEHKEYPKALADLGDDVFKRLPKDYFTGKPLKYQQKENGKGYLLYSVGANYEDDEGTSLYDKTDQGEHVKPKEANDLEFLFEKRGNDDDIVLRLPLPKFDIQQLLYGKP